MNPVLRPRRGRTSIEPPIMPLIIPAMVAASPMAEPNLI